MGRALADDAERTLPLVSEGNSNTYLDALGRQLIAKMTGTRYPYQFKIVDDNTINAWALPGGFIYVTSGLIQAAQNEPQLAGAVAHQIAHVLLRHSTAQVSQAYAEQVPNATRGRVTVNDAFNRLNIVFEPNAAPLKYTREQERQAFVVATQILYDAGFDPQTMNQFFQRVSNDRSNRTTDFFTAHPDLNNRAATVRTELRNIGPLPRNLRGDSPDFHSVKDRLAAVATNSGGWPSISDRNRPSANRGNLPSTRTALYSGRDIEFRYPENWRVSDGGDSITIAPDNGYVYSSLAYGMMIGTYEPQNRGNFPRNSFSTQQGTRTNSTLSAATNELIDHLQQANPNMRVVRNAGRRTVDGAQAMVVELTNDSSLGGTETNWLVAVLRPNGLLRYFVGVAPQEEFNRYQSAFSNIVTSVQFLD
jgi:hypothetical protein